MNNDDESWRGPQKGPPRDELFHFTTDDVRAAKRRKRRLLTVAIACFAAFAVCVYIFWRVNT